MKRFVDRRGYSALDRLGGGGVRVGASQPLVRLRDFVCRQADLADRSARSPCGRDAADGRDRKLQMRFDLLSKPKGGFGYTLGRRRRPRTWISPNDPTLGQRAARRLERQEARSSEPRRAGGVPPAGVVPLARRRRPRARQRPSGSPSSAPSPSCGPTCWSSRSRSRRSRSGRRSTATSRRSSTPARRRRARSTSCSRRAAACTTTTRPEPRLAAHRQLVVTFVGPACSTTSATTVTVDPAGARSTTSTARTTS